ARAVPDLVWALFFVTAVGLGPFPGGLALAVHSVGMLGRLFAETIEQMDMAPIDALALTGARRIQIFTHGIIPSVLPSLLGISLYRLDENIRGSLVLGFVGAGGLGFELLTAMNLFQYRTVSMTLLVIFALVIMAERLSAALRRRVACSASLARKESAPAPPDERHIGDADREVEAGLRADRQRLEAEGAIEAADQDIGARAHARGSLSGRAYIIALERPGAEMRARGE